MRADCCRCSQPLQVKALPSKIQTKSPRPSGEFTRKEFTEGPCLLQVDPGREFMGAVTQAIRNKGTAIQRRHPEIHRDQAIAERFNRKLAERLFGHLYAVEMRLPEGQRAVMWGKRLPRVVAALSQQVTRLTLH